MDEDELAKAVENTREIGSCLKKAIGLASQQPWLRDPSLQSSLQAFYCKKLYSVSFVLNVHHEKSATAYVRVNKAPEMKFEEVSLGGERAPITGNCEQIFLSQIRENTLKVREKLEAEVPGVTAQPVDSIKAGMAELLKANTPAVETKGRILQSGTGAKRPPSTTFETGNRENKATRAD